MKNFLFIYLMFLSLISQAQVTVDWFNYPSGVSIATDQTNNVYTAYWDYNPAGDITLTKRNSAGSVIWNATYNNTDNTKHEVATWVETDNAGNILVSGTIRSGYSNPVNAASILMKYNPSGTLLWRVVYESSFDGSSTTKCLVDANNNVYVLGIGTGPNGQVTKVKKFNSSGVSVWNYYDSGIGAPVTFKFTPDNKILIVHRGITGSLNGFSKIDLNGNNIWSMAGVASLSTGDAAGDASGNTYIINGGNPGSVLKKLSPTGTVLWTQTNSINGNKVEVGTDNNPVVGGYAAVGYGVAVMKYDANGNFLWQNLDADGPGFVFLALAPMKLDASNAAYIAGSTMSQMGLCKVNSNGTSAWSATTSSGYPVCMDFGTDNSVYLTGGTTARFTQAGSIQAPVAPSNLSAIASGSSVINLSWTDNATNETSYLVQRSLLAGSGFVTIATLPANSTTYSNTGLAGSTTYYYRIKASNSTGTSANSNVANATTAPLTIPTAPSNLTAVVNGCNSILLSWVDNSTNENSFQIRRSTTLNGTYTTIATVAANTTTYSNLSLVTGIKYYYRVRAFNAAGNSPLSNKANATAACLAEQTTKKLSQSIKLFPNPTNTGKVQLNLPEFVSLPVDLKVYNLAGQEVMQMQLNEYQNAILTEDLLTGFYILHFNIDGEVHRLKLQIME
ncbi:MAG: fibronectin type III domain-containing protein [Bacteroidetes bacterium]|nr:fibronectin type III domain-containing protein [Bacteroidota bacterium]